MKRGTFVVVLLLLFALRAYSENKFTATASSTMVSVGEQIQITFTLNSTNGKNFQPPSFKGFTVLAGPSRSMSTQIINGQISSSMSFIYILLADAEGTFTIEPAKITVDGNVLTSNPITIKVVKSDNKAQQQRQSPTQESEKTLSQQADEIIRNNLFIRLFVDKSQVYVGETIVATYKIYVHPDLNIVNINVPKMPSFNGFWTQDFGIKELKFTTEVVNGIPYRVADLKQVVLIPQQKGTLVIDPMEIEFLVRLLIKQQPQKKRYRDPFDMLFDDPFFSDPFFTTRYKDFPFTVRSKPVSIKVLPLPEPTPSDFRGGVGTMQMKAWLDKDRVKTGEVATLKVQVSGKGNLKLLTPFQLNLPADIDVYEPKIVDNTNVTPNGVSGNVTFEYYLIPKNPGEYKIEPIKFAYFDLEQKQYVTLSSTGFVLNVEKGATQQTLVANIKKEDVQYIGKDIRYIKTRGNSFQHENENFYASPIYWAFSLLPIGLWLVVFAYIRRKEKIEGNIILMRQIRATKIAQKYLKNAKKLITNGQKEKFYEETSRALWTFVANKLNIKPTDLTKDTIKEKLIEKVNEPEIVDNLLELINKCEEARYSPQFNNIPLDQIYSQSVEVLSKLSEKLL
ncbi:MAG: BatD family protein [Ignavibacteria bacterium]|nr:BatD family protein [Ignavibacteria bacterium]